MFALYEESLCGVTEVLLALYEESLCGVTEMLLAPFVEASQSFILGRFLCTSLVLVSDF
jgi:hypothetical protein